jgi:hypothetical protein
VSHVHGAAFYATGPLPHYQPATLDVRGLLVVGSQLLLSSSYAAEPNRDMPHTDDVWAERTAWGGVVRVRGPDGDTGVPREAAGSRPRLVSGFSGRRNLWAFTYEHPRSLWVVLDRARYVAANASGAAAWRAAMRAHTPDVAAGPDGGPAFELLALSLNAPRFDADAVERVKGQVISGLQRQAQNPESLCRNALYAAAFPGHPYGRPEKGDVDSVSRLEAQALKGLSRDLLARAGLKLVVVGDITAASLSSQYFLSLRQVSLSRYA